MGKRWNLSLRNMEIDSKIALPIFEKRRNFSLITRYSLKFTLLSVLVVKSLVTRCKIRSLGVAEVARCKNHSLLVAEFAPCKDYSLLVTKFARYSLQKLFVAKKLFVTRCRS